MLYNKNNVRKTNDKKILHKVGKQWKVVSVALLMAVAGGAVATTNANAQSNNYAAYEGTPSVVSAAPVSAASATSNTSATAKSTASSAFSASAVNPTDPFATAKNHAVSGASAENQAQSDSVVVANYVKSLNAKFPEAVNLANAKISSASSAEASDNAKANYYNGVAQNSANSATVSSLAAKNGLTAKDYANVVSVSEAANSTAVSDAQNSANALSLVASLAKGFAGNDWSVASNVASSKANSLSVKALVFNDENSEVFPKPSVNVSSFASDVNTSVNSSLNSDLNSLAGSNNKLTNAQYKLYSAEFNSTVNSAALSAANSASVSASVETLLANTNASQATSDMTSVASALGVDFASVNAFVSSEASSEVSAASKVGASSASASVNYSKANSSANSALDFAVNNSYSASAAASVTASANTKIASANAKSALYSNAVVAASAALKSVNSASTELSDASTVTSLANVATSTIDKNLTSASSSAFLNSLVNAATMSSNRKSAVASVLGVTLPSGGLNSAEKLMAAGMASAEGVDLLALKSDASAVKGVLSAGSNAMASAKTKSGYNFLSAASSVENSMAQSASSAVSSATSMSNAYAQSNDTDVVLASSYASSYAADASAEANYIDNVYLGLAAFGAQNGLDTTAYNNAAKSEPNEVALAKALLKGAYNNAPKYVTTEKSVGVYKNGKKLVTVPAGVRLKVTAVAVSKKNGQLRFVVTYKGHNGTVNSYKSYVKQTYLTSAKDVDLTVVKDSKVYNSMNFSKKSAVATLKAGTKLNNVNVVSSNGVYGGFTAVQLTTGKYATYFVSANVDYAAPVSSNNNNNPTPAAPANNSFFF